MVQDIAIAFVSAVIGSSAVIFVAKQTFTASLEHALKRILQDHEIGAKSDLEFRKQQLCEFYGPIYAYMKLAEGLYKLWMAQKLQEINLEIVDLFRRRNEEVMHLLASKMHLVDGAVVPPEFARFATSVTLWNLYTARPGQPWVPQEIAGLEEAKWPVEFQEYIYAKTEELKSTIAALHDRYALVKSRS